MVISTVQAGDTEAVLRVDRVAPVLFRGRVVDSSGAPLEAVRVSLSMTTETTGMGYSSVGGRSELADADGMFELEYIPNESLFLVYGGEQIIPDRQPLPAEDPGELQTIVLPRRSHFRIELSSTWAHADQARFEDAEGESLGVHRYRSGGSSSFPVVKLKEGHSEPLATADTAVTLILFKDSVEIHRMPIQLTGEGVQVLRP